MMLASIVSDSFTKKNNNMVHFEALEASRALVACNKAVHNEAQRPQQSWRNAS